MTEPLSTGTRPRWTDLATLGYGLAALGPVILLIAVLAWGLETDGETGFFAVIIGIAAAAALLTRLPKAWAKVAAILLGVLMLGGLWWTIFGLFAGPSSFFDFMSGVLVLPGALTGLVFSASSFIALKRGHVRVRADGRERSGIRLALIVVAAAAILSGALTLAGRSTVDDASSAAATVVMKDFEFKTTQISVAGGSTVLARNDDPFLHTFTVADLDIDQTTTPGSEKLITIPTKPGTYVLYCKPHTEDPENPGKDDMVATLRVT